jgi:hypothetical protein
VAPVVDPAVAPFVDPAVAPVVDPVVAPVGDLVAPVRDPLLGAAGPVADVGSAFPGVAAPSMAGAQVPDPILPSPTDSSWLPDIDTSIVLGADELRLATTLAFVFGSLALSAKLASRAGECAAPAQIMFTNMRLIPCTIGDTLRRSSAVATESVQGAFERAGARRSSPGGPASRTSLGGAASRTFFEPIQKGFASATHTGGKLAHVDGGADSRLLMQLGVLLGMVYTAFLTFWFWATRTRLERRW